MNPCKALLHKQLFTVTLGAAFLLLVHSLVLQNTAWAQAPTAWQPLVERLAADGFDSKKLEAMFSRPEFTYTSKPLRNKLRGLYRSNFGHRRVKHIQQALNGLGYAAGKADGAFGPKTASAIEAYQKATGLEVDGLPSKELEEALEGTTGKAIGSSGWTTATYQGARHPLWLAEAMEFAIMHRPFFVSMQELYQVPASIAGGIITVETRQGTFLGGRPAVISLASMARGTDFAVVEPMFKGISLDEYQKAWLRQTAEKRADWAYNELVALLRLADDLGRDPFTVTGSPLGAIGIAQFMPSNVSKHGADGDNDGHIDLFTPADAIHSAGRYLHDYGWTPETITLEQKRKVLWGYNHSQRYVNSVLAVASHLKSNIDQGITLAAARRPKNTAPPIRVANSVELVRALRPGAHILLTAGDYYFEEQALPQSAHMRWINGAPVIFGLEGLRIQAEGRARFISPVTKGAAFSFFQCPDLWLENIEFRAPPPKKDALARNEKLTLVELLQCPRTTLLFCLLTGTAGKGLNALDAPEMHLHLSLIQHCTAGAISLKNCEATQLYGTIIKRCEGGPLLQAENSSGLLWQRAFLHHNAALDAPLLLLTKSDMQMETAVLERNSFGGLAIPEKALQMSEAYSSGNKLKK